VVALDGDAHVHELAMGGGGSRNVLEFLELLDRPHGEAAGFGRGVEDESRGAAQAFVEYHGRATAGGGEQAAAAVVAGDQRGFGRREGNAVVALRRHAVHPQGSRQAQRHLHHADGVLDIALIERKLIRSSVQQCLPQRGVETRFRPQRLGAFPRDLRAPCRHLRQIREIGGESCRHRIGTFTAQNPHHMLLRQPAFPRH
jgi:hypothetical protein